MVTTDCIKTVFRIACSIGGTRGRAITNDWRRSSARAIGSSRATSGDDQRLVVRAIVASCDRSHDRSQPVATSSQGVYVRPVYDLLRFGIAGQTFWTSWPSCCDWFCSCAHPRPLRPVVRSFYDLPAIPNCCGRSQAVTWSQAADHRRSQAVTWSQAADHRRSQAVTWSQAADHRRSQAVTWSQAAAHRRSQAVTWSQAAAHRRSMCGKLLVLRALC